MLKVKRCPSDCYAKDVILKAGFEVVDDQNLLTRSVFKKDGQLYQFGGWESKPNDPIAMASNPKYINMRKI